MKIYTIALLLMCAAIVAQAQQATSSDTTESKAWMPNMAFWAQNQLAVTPAILKEMAPYMRNYSPLYEPQIGPVSNAYEQYSRLQAAAEKNHELMNQRDFKIMLSLHEMAVTAEEKINLSKQRELTPDEQQAYTQRMQQLSDRLKPNNSLVHQQKIVIVK